jgi:hypothetical protein
MQVSKNTLAGSMPFSLGPPRQLFCWVASPTMHDIVSNTNGMLLIQLECNLIHESQG